MLPPGHVAAGYLTAQAFITIVKPDLNQTQLNQLLMWGALFGFIPDLDVLYSFIREKALTVRHSENNHRKYYSHTPVLWLLAGVVVYFVAPGSYGKMLGLLLWLASWSHFLLDSIQYGIMWLWPFSNRIYALKDREVEVKGSFTAPGFWGYWLTFMKFYTRQISFYIEIFIILIALIVIV